MLCRAALAASLIGTLSLPCAAQAERHGDPSGQASTRAGPLTLERAAIPAAGDISSLTTRLAAVRIFVHERMTADSSVRNLLACALADRDGAVRVVADGESWLISLPEPESAIRVARTLERARAEYGSPLVGVEPLRPTSIDDQAACDRLMSFLDEVGIRTADAARVRGDRRGRADAAFAGGLDPNQALGAVDELDLDFIIRTSLSVSASADSMPYQVPVVSTEATVIMSITRLGSREAVELAPMRATARSLTRQSAEWQAKERALGDAAAASATQIANEWVAYLDGSRPWILELTGATHESLGGIQSEHPALKAREHRPGVRSLLEGPARDIIAAAGVARGTIEHSRPGYIRVRCDTEAGNLASWTAGATVGAGIVAAILWVTRRRSLSRPVTGLSDR